MRLKNILLFLFILPFYALATKPDTACSKSELVKIVTKVNNQWQATHSSQAKASWGESVYQIGNIEAYKLTANEAYLKYSEDWANCNKWMGAASSDTLAWATESGDSLDCLFSPNNQTCFQAYINLYKLDPQPYKIAQVKKVIDYQTQKTSNAYWWWTDGLYMSMPVMTKLYAMTNDKSYLKKMSQCFEFTKWLLYDRDAGLFYQNSTKVYPAHKTNNSLKDFNSRGNGMAFVALVEVLRDLPETDKNRLEYVTIYKGMAKALLVSQQPEGYWTRSILDPEQAPGAETSGTAFFTYGLLWGMNNGLLSKETYTLPALKAWEYLTKIALQKDGEVGYVQPSGQASTSGQAVSASSTANFGVGAFLLAACEMSRFEK